LAKGEEGPTNVLRSSPDAIEKGEATRTKKAKKKKVTKAVKDVLTAINQRGKEKPLK